ncbi:MAG TPA: hypothetical protein VFH38_07375 [Jatrophihabitans sp.]|nr:hypothetical protein [Jatrophihabitans sp.]
MAAQPEHRELAVYAIRVRGRLGHLLLSRLPCRTATTVEPRSVLLTRAGATDLVELVRRLARSGVQIEWIRERADPTS